MPSIEIVYWLREKAKAFSQYIKSLFKDDDDWMNPDLVHS